MEIQSVFLFWATFDSKLFLTMLTSCWCFLNRLMGRRGGQVHPLDRWWAWTPSVNFMWVDMKNTHLSYCLRAHVSRTAFKVLFLSCFIIIIVSFDVLIHIVSDEISLSFLDHLFRDVSADLMRLLTLCEICVQPPITKLYYNRHFKCQQNMVFAGWCYHSEGIACKM